MAEEMITDLENDTENVLYGLEAWTNFLSTKPLPARASTLKRLNKLIKSKASTVQQLSVVVKKDPVLTLYVVRAAQLKHNEKNSEVKSILHAVTSLGYDGVQEIAEKISPMSLNPTNVQQKRFLHAIATSHHAAYQVQEWMSFKNLPLIDESYFSALFYSVGLWALWLHAPLHMQKIQTRIHELGESPMEVEQEILGCSMQMISQQLSKKWLLSELTQEAQSHKTSPSLSTLKMLHRRAQKDPNISRNELRTLNHLTQQKFFPIKLANWLALNASRDWYSQSTLDNIDLVCDYLQIPIEKTIALIHRTCGQSSRDYFAPGIVSPAAQLLFIQSDVKIHYKMGKKELSLLSDTYPEPEVPMIKPIDLDKCKDQYVDIDFYQRIESHLNAKKLNAKFSKPAQVFSALLQGLEKGLGIKSIALLAIGVKTNSLKSVQTIGIEAGHPLSSLNIKYGEKGTLSDLCNNPFYVVYDRNSQQKLTPLIKNDFLSYCSKTFMIISIFKSNQPIAIIYIDMKNKEITNFERERTRHLCHCSAFALEQL